MDIQGKVVLVMGGWGLVGNALTRKLMVEEPRQIIISSLRKEEALEQVNNLKKDYPDMPDDYFVPWWGNIFVRYEFKDENRFEILKDPDKRKVLMHDFMDEMTPDILENSSVYKLITEHNPDVIVDCINSATGIAYQDIYTTYHNIKKTINNNPTVENLAEETEKLLCTLYIPQLIRHIQLMYASMNKAKTKIYIKIGTSGTGGMGLNIPYTHSEEKPSRVLLSKSCVAGAHTLLLFLMGRTPEGAITKEIKPTAAIAWKRIEFGEITKGGQPIKLYEVPFDQTTKLEGSLSLQLENEFPATGENLKSVFIDTGENGTFSRGEFEAITTQGQMEYVTPEEIAEDAIFEIKGGNTGHDIINALDNATLEPTYRAGYLQHSAVSKLRQLEKLNDKDSVAFELLGPPRLSKLLYEIYLIKKVYPKFKEIINADHKELSAKIVDIIKSNDQLRNEITSIGMPILLPDGKSLIRGNKIKIPPFRGENEYEVTDEKIEIWAHDGWIDLREKNMLKWQKRLQEIVDISEAIPESDTSSHFVRTKQYWNEFDEIDIGKVVGWLFIDEEHGKRMKA
ncbi:MAG: short-chain dehydrogenase [Melioribacteraceae bacterium]|nr:short-chain dehydrogenase [Melioribacteraceae bacterium]MCF8354284.1 short-chain dehydrogenase [Melioribacteraceae bacterium]MCF8394584.1 short-chain dehydrogenase [Melioribacteraceae bacterium]MCF8419747.1 short-chain dehydrogenase [Melioribacteraceae bacterium]